MTAAADSWNRTMFLKSLLRRYENLALGGFGDGSRPRSGGNVLSVAEMRIYTACASDIRHAIALPGDHST